MSQINEPQVRWYSLRQLSKELGMSVNTFKKYYIDRFPPDRENQRYKGYTHKKLLDIKAYMENPT